MSRQMKVNGRDTSMAEGCGIMVVAIFAIFLFSALLVAGLAVVLMFAWSFVAPLFGLPLIDFPAAAAIVSIFYILAILIRN